MYIYYKTLLSLLCILMLVACYPSDQQAMQATPNQKQAIDKARNVEKMLLDQNKTIDRTINAAGH